MAARIADRENQGCSEGRGIHGAASKACNLHHLMPPEQFGNDARAPLVIAKKSASKPCAIARSERLNDLRRLLFKRIQELGFEPLKGLEPFEQAFERKRMFGVAGCSCKLEEDDVLPLG